MYPRKFNKGRLKAGCKSLIILGSDFFTLQPIQADVYYFRSIFHNWSDKYCIQILQNLVPALKLGAKIVIHEYMLPDLKSLSTADAKRAM